MQQIGTRIRDIQLHYEECPLGVKRKNAHKDNFCKTCGDYHWQDRCGWRGWFDAHKKWSRNPKDVEKREGTKLSHPTPSNTAIKVPIIPPIKVWYDRDA